MIFERSRASKRFGQATGYLIAYLFSSTVLFYILFFLKKLPKTWTFFHVMDIVLAITITGLILKRLLR